MAYRSYVLISLCLFHLACLTGCASLNKEKYNRNKEQVELRKKHFQDLLDALTSHKISHGTPTQTIQEEYGNPDDIFQSGSSVSTFEIWSYEKVLDKKNESWQTIQLYFENNKLINWKL